MLDHAKEFDDQVHNMVKHRRNLRIGLTKSAGSAAYMEYFSNEAEKYQNVEIKVTVDSTSELIERNCGQEAGCRSGPESRWSSNGKMI